jgi:hypothetical protein
MLEPRVNIWTKRMRIWLTLPDGVAQFAESPTPQEFQEAVSS